MKKQRKELEKYLLEQCEKIAFYPEKCEEVRKNLLQKYNIPRGTTMDMIVRGRLEEQTEHILFCLLDGIKDFVNQKTIVEEFFMPVEIEKYSTTKIIEEKIKFPIVIKCLQVEDDQWIGATDTSFFMDLRKIQKINYNENTQRTLTKIITRNGEYYKITVKEETVAGIRGCLQRGEYIPTPITLNIPLESNTDFYYDEEQNALIINSLEYFDILDGYHRYVAMSREKDVNPEFNCSWELRIVNFAEDRAKYFVFQEDLKTKMKKIDSKAMNTYSAANRVADLLNKDSSFNLFREINDAGGKISFAEFAKVIEAFYFKDTKAANENELVIKVKNELKSKINYLTEVDESYLTKAYTYVDLLIMVYVFANADELSSLDNYIKGITANTDQISQAKLSRGRNITKTVINDLDRIFAEVK